jgi:LysM repeat protein
MTRMHTRIARTVAGGARRRWLTAAALLLALYFGAALLATPDAAAQTATPAAASTYVVQPGDSWTSVSRKTGLTIRELQAANPGSVRASGWLIVGEELVIPGAATPPPAATPDCHDRNHRGHGNHCRDAKTGGDNGACCANRRSSPCRAAWRIVEQHRRQI